MRGAIDEDEVLVACEVEVLEVGEELEDDVLVVRGVLELVREEENEEDEGPLDTALELELDELEEDVVVVLDDFGRVAMYPAATITISIMTTITTVCTLVTADLDPTGIIVARSPSHII
jgi:hypothetical protein